MNKYSAKEPKNLLESMGLENPIDATGIECLLKSISLDYLVPGKGYGVAGVCVEPGKSKKLDDSKKGVLYHVKGPERKSIYFDVIFDGDIVKSIERITLAKEIKAGIKEGIGKLQKVYAEIRSK